MFSLRCAKLGLGLIAACGLAAAAGPAHADIFKKPSRIKELGTSTVVPDDSVDVLEITPTAANGGIYTVPNKMVFVITDVWVFPQSPGPGMIKLTLEQEDASGAVGRDTWTVSNQEPTQLRSSSGLVIAPGFSLRIANFFTSDGSAVIDIFGYEAKNK